MYPHHCTIWNQLQNPQNALNVLTVYANLHTMHGQGLQLKDLWKVLKERSPLPSDSALIRRQQV